MHLVASTITITFITALTVKTFQLLQIKWKRWSLMEWAWSFLLLRSPSLLRIHCSIVLVFLPFYLEVMHFHSGRNCFKSRAKQTFVKVPWPPRFSYQQIFFTQYEIYGAYIPNSFAPDHGNFFLKYIKFSHEQRQNR